MGLLVRKDMVYCDTNMATFSIVRITPEWKLWSEQLNEKYSGYCLDR